MNIEPSDMKTKKPCKICGEKKPLFDFNWAGYKEEGHRRNICKVCQRKREAETREKRKNKKIIYVSMIDEFLCNQTYISMLATCWEWRCNND